MGYERFLNKIFKIFLVPNPFLPRSGYVSVSFLPGSKSRSTTLVVRPKRCRLSCSPVYVKSGSNLTISVVKASLICLPVVGPAAAGSSGVAGGQGGQRVQLQPQQL